MKKKGLFFIIALMGVCLSFLVGCSVFGGLDSDGGKEDNNGPSDSVIETQLKAPESVRLDIFTMTLYVPDCSSSGVTYYKIFEKYSKASDSDKIIIGSLDTSGMQAEDGYFAIDVKKLVVYYSFELTVFCTRNATDKEGVMSNKFIFENGGGIIYDEEHCSFDDNTGLFTWTAVEGATGYRIETGDEVKTVDSPQYTVDQSVTSFKITPLFDGYKFGSAQAVYLSGVTVSVQYNAYTHEFSWTHSAGNYRVEITENGETSSWELTEDRLPYAPSSDSVTIKIITYNPLRRSGVTEVTYDVVTPIYDIALDAITRRLTWSSQVSASKYDLIFEYGSGTSEVKESAYAVLAMDKNRLGAAKVKIRPVLAYTTDTKIYLYSEFEYYMLGYISGIKPNIKLDGESGKLSIAISSDWNYIESYVVSLTAEGAEEQVAEMSDVNPVQMNLTKYRLSKVVISRKYKGGEGHYCFADNPFYPSDYSSNVLYVGAPEVEMKDKNAENSSGRAFTVKVKFPEELKGKGSLTLTRNYTGYKESTSKLSGDAEFTLPFANASAHLEFVYSEFNISSSSSAIVLSDKFQTDVNCLESVELSADASAINWQTVGGAASYRVEKLDGEDYAEVYSGTDTQYIHGVHSAGKNYFRVVAVSDKPFVLDSAGAECSVQKLEKPTVTLNQAGEIEITSPDAAAIVTLLDGAEAYLTHDNLRAVMNDKATATLVAYCAGNSTQRAVIIPSEHTGTYTLHRIADLHQTGWGLTVDAQTSTVYWSALEGAGDYVCNLYHRVSADDDYSLVHSFTGNVTELDGSQLTCGQYELEIKPVGSLDDMDIYLYLGDIASDTFQKDGIQDVALLADGTGFSIDGIVYQGGDYGVGWQVKRSDYSNSPIYLFEMGNRLIFSENDEVLRDFSSLQNGNTYTLYFNIDYSNASDAVLGKNKTLKAEAFTLSFTIKQSASGYDFTGKYSYLEREDNSQPYARITLTPDPSVILSDAESYGIVYKTKGYGASNNSATLVSYTMGTELTIPVGNDSNTQMFRLGISSNKFTEMDGSIVFYRTEPYDYYLDDAWYMITLQQTITASVKVTDAYTVSATGKAHLNIELNFQNNYIANGDTFNFEYLSDKGLWQKFSYGGNYDTAFSGKTSFAYSFAEPNDLKIAEGKVIKLRVRRGNYNFGGVKRDASDWTFIWLTVPALTIR